MNINTLAIQALIVILLMVGVLTVPSLLAGSAPLINLKPAAPLVGEISQALGADDSNKLPVAGKGFTIKSIQNFDDNQLVVAAINTSTVRDNAYVVLQKKPSYYAVVLGPGTSFAHSSLKLLPSDVARYLENQKVVDASS